jgi:hypothetical protein
MPRSSIADANTLSQLAGITITGATITANAGQSLILTAADSAKYAAMEIRYSNH